MPSSTPTFAELKAKDYADLKARIEAALAESVKAAGNPAAPKDAPPSVFLHVDHTWALVTAEDTRAILTDPAVKTLGGGPFVITVDDDGVTIARQATAPAPEPTPAHS